MSALLCLCLSDSLDIRPESSSHLSSLIIYSPKLSSVPQQIQQIHQHYYISLWLYELCMPQALLFLLCSDMSYFISTGSLGLGVKCSWRLEQQETQRGATQEIDLSQYEKQQRQKCGQKGRQLQKNKKERIIGTRWISHDQ